MSFFLPFLYILNGHDKLSLNSTELFTRTIRDAFSGHISVSSLRANVVLGLGAKNTIALNAQMPRQSTRVRSKTKKAVVLISSQVVDNDLLFVWLSARNFDKNLREPGVRDDVGA